jgi:hypothetical protein
MPTRQEVYFHLFVLHLLFQSNNVHSFAHQQYQSIRFRQNTYLYLLHMNLTDEPHEAYQNLYSTRPITLS